MMHAGGLAEPVYEEVGAIQWLPPSRKASRPFSIRIGRCRRISACSAKFSAIPCASTTAAFEIVEAIRRLSVAFQRKSDETAGRNLDTLLSRLSPADTVSVIRAFSYFSHLANLAEDRHHVCRRLVHEVADAPQDGSLARSFVGCCLRVAFDRRAACSFRSTGSRPAYATRGDCYGTAGLCGRVS